MTGLHKSPFHGFSAEFNEHRLYNKGESTRHIDWKLYARTDKLFVKRYEEETNLRCDTYREDVKISAFGGAKFYIGATPTARGRKSMDDVQSVSVTALYEYSKLSDQLNIGAYWNKNPFTLGLWVRGIPVAVREESYSNMDAFILLLGYKIFDLHIGYSYDFSIGELLSTTGGAHELSVMYEFQPKAKAKKRHAAISCPKL